MSKSPKTGRRVEEQRVSRGSTRIASFVRRLAGDSDSDE